jgi:hypothetical protein
MIAKMKLAVSIPMPYGGPAKIDDKNGMPENPEIRAGCTYD